MNKRVGLIGVAAILSVSAWFVSGSGVHAFSGQSASVERRSSSPNAHSSGQREATAQGNSSKADSRTRPDNGNGDKDGSHPSGSKQEVRVVRGSFVNEVLICSGEPQQTSDPITFHATCKIGSLYTGGFTGHTIGKLDGTYDVNGDAKGTYDEWFYGVYTGDNTIGGFHFRGTFTVEGGLQQAFFAEAKIVGGTCGFAGSSGTFTADGIALNGGFTANWIRPRLPVAQDPTCNPVDPESLPR